MTLPVQPEVHIRKTSFDDVPAELKILIISYVDLDPATFRSLSLLNHQTHQFLKRYEVELVNSVVRHRNRLAGLLALPARPTFKDYLILQIEERGLNSSILILKQNGVYEHCFRERITEGEDVFRSAGPLLMLIAGFYVHYRAARLKSRLELEDFMMNVSEEAWALVKLFSLFVMQAVRLIPAALVPTFLDSWFIPSPSADVRAPEDRTAGYRKVADEVLQEALYFGMHSLDDFLRHRYHSTDIMAMSDVADGMAKFLGNSLEKSVLVKEDDIHSYNDHLRLALDSPTIQLGRRNIPGKGRVVKMYQADYPHVTKAVLRPGEAPKVHKITNSGQNSPGIEFNRSEGFASPLVLTITGVQAAAQAGYDELMSKLLELGVDNRSLAGGHLVEATALENLKDWNCHYTTVMLSCSLPQPFRGTLHAPQIQARNQPHQVLRPVPWSESLRRLGMLE